MRSSNMRGVLIAGILIAAVFAVLFFIGQKNNDSVIKTYAGENFKIMLESNPATGYAWQISGDLDTDMLELVGSSFMPIETDLVGVPGKEEWVFRAKGEGRTEISLKYVRPWEKDNAPAETKSFEVIILK